MNHTLEAGTAGCARCGLPVVAFGLLPQCDPAIDAEGHLEALQGQGSPEADAVLEALEEAGYGTVGSA